jgi:hypothetical protein
MANRRHFGTVRKRPSGRWQAVYWQEGGPHSAGTFATKADALARLSTVEADFRRGTWIDPSAGQVTLKTYANEWIARRPDLAIRTRELYEDLLRLHILPCLGQTTIAGIAPSKVRAWNAELTVKHPSTASKAYRLLSTMMRNAVDDDLIAKTPCKVVGAATEHAAERPNATIPEIEALSLAMPSHQESLTTKGSRSGVRFDPIGTIFAVMPWNFPCWQVIRMAVPARAHRDLRRDRSGSRHHRRPSDSGGNAHRL